MQMKRLCCSHIGLLVRRLAVLYAVLLLCQVVFYLYNIEQLGALSWHETSVLLRGAMLFNTASLVYADGLFVLLSLLPFPIRERKWYGKMLFGYYVTVNTLLLVVVNLADCVYFRYAQKRFSADEIFFADNSNSLQLVGKFTAENWYLVLFGAVLIALLVWGYGRKVKVKSLLHRGWAYYTVNSAIFVVGALLCIAGMRGGMTRMTRPITLSNATLYTPDSGKANMILSNPFCILRTIGSSGVKYKKYFSPEELPSHFTPDHLPADSVAVSLAGHNLVIFIMESMSAEHSAYLMPEIYADKPTKGFTPFLDSLMRNGLCFRQMYANGTRSIQAMPSVLGSIPSFKQPFVLLPQALGRSRQLPAILAGKGYATAFLCGSERGSMGFGAYARSAGVDRLIGKEDYEARHGTNDFDNYWGIWDEPFLQFAGEEFTQMPQPFFATLFSLSAHHPFIVPDKYNETLPDGYTKIHKSVAYDDQAFRLFFERYCNEAWFRRTLFVFVADHVSSEKFAETTRTYPGNTHIIGFAYTPDGSLRGEITEVTQQIDLMPTLLGLLGNTEPYFAFGRDLFNEPSRPKWAVSYENGFRAMTDKSLIVFDETQAHITSREGAATDETTDKLIGNLKGLIQQYYTHIERKEYIYRAPND